MLPLLCYLVAFGVFAGSLYLLSGALPNPERIDANLVILAIAGLVAALLLATFGRICQMLETLVKQRALAGQKRTNHRGLPEEPRLVAREE